jgi:hypothetical protein
MVSGLLVQQVSLVHTNTDYCLTVSPLYTHGSQLQGVSVSAQDVKGDTAYYRASQAGQVSEIVSLEYCTLIHSYTVHSCTVLLHCTMHSYTIQLAPASWLKKMADAAVEREKQEEEASRKASHSVSRY